MFGKKHWPVASHWQTLSHNVVSSKPRHELTTLVVIKPRWYLETKCVKCMLFLYIANTIINIVYL
jgi:hypothetical protein